MLHEFAEKHGKVTKIRADGLVKVSKIEGY